MHRLSNCYLGPITQKLLFCHYNFRVSKCLYICQSVYLSSYLPTYKFIYWYIFIYIYLTLITSRYLFISPLLYLNLSLYLTNTSHSSFYLYLFISLSFSHNLILFYNSLYLFHFLYLFLSIYITLSIFPYHTLHQYLTCSISIHPTISFTVCPIIRADLILKKNRPNPDLFSWKNIQKQTSETLKNILLWQKQTFASISLVYISIKSHFTPLWVDFICLVRVSLQVVP